MRYYFDDYGAKQAYYTGIQTEILGKKEQFETVEIMTDNVLINYSKPEKTGTRQRNAGMRSLIGATNSPGTNMPADMPKDIPADLPKEIKGPMQNIMKAEKKEMPLQSQVYLGKTCKGTALYLDGELFAKSWTWEGIPMYCELGSGNKAITMTVTFLQTDILIPADKFQVPSDIKITDR